MKTDITALLQRAKDGHQESIGDVYALLHAELAQIARARLRGGRNQTLNTVALVNESYVKLVEQQHLDVEGRAHFLALASRAMRHILIDHFRRKTSAKRGALAPQITLHEQRLSADEPGEALLELDEALTRLQQHDPRLAQVVECRFFGGMDYDEIGASLGLAARTVRLDWRKAKAWLSLELSK
ncbi:MAG: ECF-type sigma factor [Gammaproteobacteria bacterium]